MSDVEEVNTTRARARVPLFHNLEVPQADGTSRLTSVLTLIEEDDDGLDPTWQALPFEARLEQIFALLEATVEMNDHLRGTVTRRGLDRTANVLDLSADVQS